MQELMNLLDKTTAGEWLLIKNEDSISVVVKTDPSKLEEGQVIIEIGGLNAEELEANGRLVLMAKKALPQLVEVNDRLITALLAALKVMEVAEVVVASKDRATWTELTTALAILGVKII